MNQPVYLDYAATTPVAAEVITAMQACLGLDGNFGNSSSRAHIYGWRAEEAVENARIDVAKLLNADAREIIFTSGATEASNLAIKGGIESRLDRGQAYAGAQAKDGGHINIVTTQVEHKCVLETCQYLQSRGVELRLVAPRATGEVDASDVLAAVDANTAFVSCMHANNETGTVNDVVSIGAALRETNTLFHVDAAQTAGKIAIDVRAMNLDLLSISAHKFYGPKGVGALFVRRHPDVKISQQTHGGGHERGMRSGTIATHQVVGLGGAASLAKQRLDGDYKHMVVLRKRFLAGIKGIEGVCINGTAAEQLPNILNIAFDNVDGELMMASLRQLAVSTGSACLSTTVEPSHVLKAMGLNEAQANSSLRFSFGRYSSADDIDVAINAIRDAYASLAGRQLAL